MGSCHGDLPAHMTFGIDSARCQYEVIRQGEKIPDEWEYALILHASNGYDALQGANLLVQLKDLNPSGIVFMLPVEIETPKNSYAEAVAKTVQNISSGVIYFP